MADTDTLLVYLAGHIHSPWRDEVRRMATDRTLPVCFVGPREDHARSDNVGFDTLGLTSEDVGPTLTGVVRDDLGGRINNLRTRVWIAKCDLLLAWFDGEHKNLRQWNTAADIATAQGLGKPVIIARSPGFVHSLKELGPRADAVVDDLRQAVDVMAYIFES